MEDISAAIHLSAQTNSWYNRQTRVLDYQFDDKWLAQFRTHYGSSGIQTHINVWVVAGIAIVEPVSGFVIINIIKSKINISAWKP